MGKDIEFTGTDRFALKRRLGAGGMGIVYEVHDREHDTRLALKTLKNIDPHSLYRLKREFRALQDLQHPNLVTLGELIEDSGRWFFTMELVRGTDFVSYVTPRRGYSTESMFEGDTLAGAAAGSEPGVSNPLAGAPKFDEERLRTALGQLVLGLVTLHDAGKVHRDIKPSNVLVTREGRVVLLDFGLAVDARDQRDTTEQHVVGTAVYMAPEQAASKAVGPQADWYSVGVVLFEALTGQVPFVGSPLKVLMDKQHLEPPRPAAIAPDVPDDLDALCQELLRFDPAERPNGAALMRRLQVTDARKLARAPSLSSQTSGTPFVGRSGELDTLRSAFDRTTHGEAVTAIVRGESGVGKTALIQHFLEGLGFENDDLVVLKGRCYERESVPYKGFDGVVDSLSRYLRRLPNAETVAVMPRNASLLSQVFPVLGRVEQIASAPRPRPEVRDPRELRNRAFAALRELLARIADRHPTVLVIDDLQWADSDSLLLLDDLMNHAESPPLMTLASFRTGTGVAANIEAMSQTVEHISLDRLPPDEAIELAALLLRYQTGSATDAASLIATEAAGHPLFIDELVRHIAETDEDAHHELRLDDAIVGRVSRLEDASARLLHLIALAGAPIRQSVVCQAAELSITEAAPSLSLLRVAHLVRATGARGVNHIEPYHDRVREAVVASLHDDERKHCHARLAIALESADQPLRNPEMLIRHLEGAGRIEEATHRAAQAARRARKALAFDRSAQLYRTALRLGDFDDERRRLLLLRLGETLANAGRGLESAEAYVEAAKGADPATRLECQRQAAEQLLTSGHIERGMEALDAVLAEVGEKIAASPTRTIMSVLWNRAKLELRGLGYTERHESEISARELTRLDVYKSVLHGLGILDPIRALDFQSRGLMLSLKAGEPTRVARSLLEAAGSAAVQGRAEAARRMLDVAAPIVERQDDPYLTALLASVNGFAHYFSGELQPALDVLRVAEAQYLENTTGASWELKTSRLAQLWVLRRIGTWAELGDIFDRYIIDAVRRGDRHMETSVRWACNDVWLARDDVDAALANLDEAKWMPPDDRFHLQHYYELRARAELDLYTGNARDTLERLAPGFRALKRSMLLRIKDINPETNYVVARCAFAAGDLSRVRKLIRALHRERVSFATVWAELLQAAVLATADDEEATLAQLRRTIEIADGAGMMLAAECGRRRYGQRVGGTEGAKLVRNAERWMTAQRIADPERMNEFIAPGLAPAP